MATVEIRGRQFPLCLTVAALDKINEKCGGLSDLGQFLDGKDGGGNGSFSQAMSNTAWVLALLIREGEENRLVNARLAGEKPERNAVPDFEEVGHLLTVSLATKSRKAVLEAVRESLQQEVEASYPKNAKNAELE